MIHISRREKNKRNIEGSARGAPKSFKRCMYCALYFPRVPEAYKETSRHNHDYFLFFLFLSLSWFCFHYFVSLLLIRRVWSRMLNKPSVLSSHVILFCFVSERKPSYCGNEVKHKICWCWMKQTILRYRVRRGIMFEFLLVDDFNWIFWIVREYFVVIIFEMELEIRSQNPSTFLSLNEMRCRSGSWFVLIHEQTNQVVFVSVTDSELKFGFGHVRRIRLDYSTWTDLIVE